MPSMSIVGIPFSKFLESTPPGQLTPLVDHLDSGPRRSLSLPTIEIHCSHGSCKGLRFFYTNTDKVWIESGNSTTNKFIEFKCKNCEKTTKTYALIIIAKADDSCQAYKLGEFPPFGPPTPSRVISLIGPDREVFLKGRRCENQGLGIGAYSYYRRIVENQKNRLFDELLSVCKKVNAPSHLIVDLESAKKETQFTKAVEGIKQSLPESLLINGQHNPLALLHSALSEGLHDHSDEDCLEYAQSIRIILTDLAERISSVLKETTELDSAVKKLMTAKIKPKITPEPRRSDE